MLVPHLLPRDALVERDFAPSGRDNAPFGAALTAAEPSQSALLAAYAVEQARPPALRRYDQIAMSSVDLARQVDLLAPGLADRHVVFMGDHDGMSVALGHAAAVGGGPMPARMTLLDFDERLLARYRQFADENGFGPVLDTCRYNVFDPVPEDLAGVADVFYTNPPYGSRNDGASVRLFLSRALECVRSVNADDATDGPVGYAVLPYDDERTWTRVAMQKTQAFMTGQGWAVGEMGKAMHGYALDDDPELRSATVRFEGVTYAETDRARLRFGGRRAEVREVPLFYGAGVCAPYPRYIGTDGSAVWWDGDRPSLLTLYPTHP